MIISVLFYLFVVIIIVVVWRFTATTIVVNVAPPAVKKNDIAVAKSSNERPNAEYIDPPYACALRQSTTSALSSGLRCTTLSSLELEAVLPP